jgi:MFS family permease
MAMQPVADRVARRGWQASWAPMVIISMAQVLLIFNITALKVSIDGICESFDISPSAVKTAIVVYSFVVAALILPGARLAQSFGARGTFRMTVALFGAAMIVMTLSAGETTMLAAQILAAVATAALLPTLAALMAETYRGPQQERALSWLSAAQAIGVVPALLIGGAVATWLEWRVAFGLLIALAAGIYVTSGMLRDTARKANARVDKIGFVLAAFAILLIGTGCNHLSDWGALIASPKAPFSLFKLSPAPFVIAGGILFAKAFLLWSHRHRARGGTPLVAPDIFNSPQERSALFSIFTVGVLSAAITFVIPLYIEVVQGRTSLYTAVALTPFAMAGFAAAILIVRLRGRLRAKHIARFAFLSVAIGAALLGATIRNDWGAGVVILSMIIVGVGEGALTTLLFDLLFTNAASRMAGDIEPLCGTADYLAAGVGTALASALILALLSSSVSRQLSANPLFPVETRAQLSLDSVSFVSNDRLRNAMSRTAATPAQVDEAVRINTEARLRALKLCFFALACLALLAFFPAAALPDYVRNESRGAT